MIIIWYILFSKQNLKSLNQGNEYTAISNNLISDQFKFDIFSSMRMRCNENHAPLENNFVLILDKYALKETKFYEGIKNPILIRTFASK